MTLLLPLDTWTFCVLNFVSEMVTKLFFWMIQFSLKCWPGPKRSIVLTGIYLIFTKPSIQIAGPENIQHSALTCVFLPPLSVCLFNWDMFVDRRYHLRNCETQPPASIGWVALSSVVCRRPSRIVTPHIISTIWCFRPYKPYIFCEDMILATCQCHSLLSWAQFTVV